MSIGKKLWNWCRVPPEPPRTGHRKLVVCSLICTIGISLFASLISFYGAGPMAEPAGNSALSSNILPVLHTGEGDSYLGNVTFQSVTEANNSTVPDYNLWLKSLNGNDSEALKTVGASAYGSGNSGKINLNIVNFGDNNLHAVAINIYDGTSLFASIPGSFTIPANSAFTINFAVWNLEKLSLIQAQQLTQINNGQQGSNETVPYIGYTFKLETAEGITLTYGHFTFPTYPEVFFRENLV